MAMGANLQSFETHSSRGFLLSKQIYRESDLIVDLLLESNLRLSALVRGGQKSIQRFGGKLEPLKLLSFQLRAPRGVVSYDKLFSLEVADLVEEYGDYKKSWYSLCEGLFYLEFFRDLSPRGDLEPWFYFACHKTLAVGNYLSACGPGDWRRLYVWFYFSKQLGFGLLGDEKLFPESRQGKASLWKELFEEEFFSEKVLDVLMSLQEGVLEKSVLRNFYADWMQRSHLKCRSLEEWILL